MILGTMMILTGATGLLAMEVAPEVCSFIKNRKRSTKDKYEEQLTITEQYTRLFESLDLMDSKVDWIKVVNDEIERHEYYSEVTFKLSDTLNVEDFQKKNEKIRQKLNALDLSVSYKQGYMVFKCRVKDLPNMAYSFAKTNNNLIPLGINLDGDTECWNLKSDPHAMLIGTTGSGKSNLLNCIINHILNNYKNSKLYLIDLKGGLEFTVYEKVKNVVAFADDLTGAEKVIAAIEEEYNARIKTMKEAGYRDYSKFINDKPNSSMKRAFIVIDEFSVLLRLNSKKDEYDAMEVLIDLAKRIRAVGMHLVLACQKPTITNIPSDLKANVGCIIGMKTRDAHNSELVIDRSGLENLNTGESISIIGNKEVFFKAPYIDDETIEATAKRFSKEDSSSSPNETVSDKVTKLF